MIALFTLLVIILVSVIAIRIGATALELTGLSGEIASFQAHSAFSGVGYTTQEAESIVSHPVRRRIIRVLFLAGSAGITTSMAALILTFMGQAGRNIAERAFVLIVGLLFILLFARSRYIHNVMKKMITLALERWTTLKVYDYNQLLGFSAGYAIVRLMVRPDSWMGNRKLADMRLDLEGILVLSIERAKDREIKFIGAPHGETVIMPGDTILCYAKQELIEKLAQRCKGKEGDEEHKEVVEEVKEEKK